MTITTQSKEKIAELIENEFSNGQLGTDTTASAVTDTDLIAAVTSTIETITVSRDGRQLITTYNIDSLTGNGNTYAEYANYFTTSETMFNRITFTGVPKNSAIEFQVSTICNVL
jgi:hypothetical protein